MVQSIIDNDLYKFTQQHAVISLFKTAQAVHRFTDRNKIDFPDGFDTELRKEIVKMSELSLSDEEGNFLKSKTPLPAFYIEYLKSYRFDPDEVDVELVDNKLSVQISGLIYRTILWEVPLMATISELYFKMTGQHVDLSSLDSRDTQKFNRLNTAGVNYADFGTRRRFSFENHDRIVGIMADMENSTAFGTSNVYLAMRYGLTPIGTQAHEWIMLHAAIYGYKMANRMAMENWIKVYNGELGIVLTDTYTTDSFLEGFDSKYARINDGVRQDSGDPLEYYNKIYTHYHNLNIEPKSKKVIFSNGLNTDESIDIKNRCNQMKPYFCIGTHFTNDVGVKPLNIVIKLYWVNFEGVSSHCVKISDDLGKNTGEANEVKLCKETLNV